MIYQHIAIFIPVDYSRGALLICAANIKFGRQYKNNT